MHDRLKIADERSCRRASAETARLAWQGQARRLVRAHSAYIAMLELGAESDDAYEQSGHREQLQVESSAFRYWVSFLRGEGILRARRERAAELGRSPSFVWSAE